LRDRGSKRSLTYMKLKKIFRLTAIYLRKKERSVDLIKLLYSKKVAKTTAREFEEFRKKLSKKFETR
jgi:hypothetical protein